MEENDDKMIRDAEFFIALRKTTAVTNNDVKITQIEEYIKNGADVNIRFPNNSNNTPLHIAVIKGDSDVVKILLKYGAETHVPNDAGKTALDLAKLLPDRSNIAKILSEHDNATQIDFDTSSIKVIREFKKRPGTANVRGQLYETKLLTMIYFRALRCKEITQFYIGTNIDDIGDIDDVCLRFKTVNDEYIVFVQAKYKHDIVKGKITYKDLWNPTDFSLLKYYISYVKARERFNVKSKDDFFCVNYEDLKPYFVLYTTIKEDISGMGKITPVVDEVVDKLIRTGKEEDVFQFTSDDKNVQLIVNILLKQRIANMAKKLIQLMPDKFERMLCDENIMYFHVVLAQKVFTVSEVNAKKHRTGVFRDDFFSTSDALLIELREALCAEVKQNIIKTAEEMDASIQNILLEPTADNISVLIDSVLVYDRSGSSLKLINEGLCMSHKYQSRLSMLRVPESRIKDAIGIADRRKLETLNDKMKFPVGFGNLDMTLTEKKAASRLDFLASKMSEVINKASDKENIVISEGVFSSTTLTIKDGFAGAIGNLLISDGEGKVKFNLDVDSTQKYARGLLERLIEILGDLKIYRFCITVDSFPRLSFHGSEKEIQLAKDFLDSLYFYTYQKKEADIDVVITKELEKNECRGGLSSADPCIKSNTLFLKVHNQVQIWWMREGSVKFLTRNMEQFDKIFQEIRNQSLLTFLNFICLNEVCKAALEFTSEAVEVLYPCKNKTATMIVVHTDVCMSTCQKLVQCCKAENLIFIDIDYIAKVSPHCFQMLAAELSATKNHNVVIVCKDTTKHNINDMISACRAIKIILVTSNFVQKEVDVYIRDERINLTDLTDESQAIVLESVFNYQGFDISFAEVFDETMKYTINSKILQKIINAEQITLGQSLELSTYANIKDYYVPRTLKFNDGSSGCNENLDDSTSMTVTTYDENSEDSNVFSPSTLIDHRYIFKHRRGAQPQDVVVLLDGPGMGKSTLLTHLSLETKKRCPKIWIQRINLIDHTKQFYEWHRQEIEIDYAVAFSFLCTIALSKRTYTDTNSDSNADVVPDHDNEDDVRSFERRVFLQSFKEGKIVFLFDGFDEIYPIYKGEVIQLIRCFTCRNELVAPPTNSHQPCVWIASRPYNRLRKILVNEFGDSFTLLPFSYKDIHLFLDKYVTRHFTLDRLTDKQLKEINEFIEHMEASYRSKIFENSFTYNLESTYMLLRSMYIAMIKHLKREIKRTYIKEDLKAFVKNWDKEVPADGLQQYMTKKRIAIPLIGVPLYVYIAVNFYKKQIKNPALANIENPNKRWAVDTNLSAFYESFFDTKLMTIWFKEKNNMDIYRPGIIELYKKEKKEFIETHKKLAYYAFFKELHTQEELDEIQNIIKSMKFGDNKTGLVDRIVDGTPIFIHYTFVEYFSVEYIVDIMKSGVLTKLSRIIHLVLSRSVGGGMTGLIAFLNLKFKSDPFFHQPFSPRVCTQIDDINREMSIPESMSIIQMISSFIGGVSLEE